ncbi:MAG: SpoIIE family protein phosphatase [Clostridia bacterium]|nr:SpoIIE family protein phosphatase [Clostridia bacterium]
MREFVKISDNTSKLTGKELFIAAVGHILIGLCGFVSTKAVVLENLLPFGLSFIAGCSATYTPACAIGIFIGYFIPAVGNGAFKYLASLFAILAVKLLLSNYKRIVTSEIFLTFITLLTSIFTTAATLKATGGSAVSLISEALISAIGAYFVSRAFKILSKDNVGLTPDELSAVLIVMNILLLGLNSINPLGVSLGKVLSVMLILTSSKYGGIISGAISGITVAFTTVLSKGDGTVAVSFAVAGLFCGVFASLGKYAQVFIFVVLSFIGAVCSGEYILVGVIITETVLGAILFLVLPRTASVYLCKIFSAYPKVSRFDGIKKSLSMKLYMASNALKDVSETVEQVSSELSKINSPDFSNVIASIENEACAGCKLRIHCWEKKRDDTVNGILEITKAIKRGDNNPESKTSEEFKGRCLRLSGVANATYRKYTDYAGKIAAENRIDQVRAVVSDQFDGMSMMLSDMASDFETQDRFDISSAENAAMALKNIDINVSECSSSIDRYGRMTIELKLKKTPDIVINKAKIMKLVSLACERNFDVPTVSEVGGEIYITICERAEIRVDFGVSQLCANDNKMCGDAYKYFNDNKGHFVMLLSDGMGTGGRAAVDGAMASGLMARLLKTGFGYNCSLKILNSSMLFKSTDESLATIDIASIDLHTGTLELYKAGAAPTIVRRSGKTGKAESTSLPVGILRDVGFDKAVVKCRIGDIVVLMSDGATTEGTDWIRAEVESWRDGTAQDLSDRLCLCARRRGSEKRKDDITVMCAILEKAL